MRDPLTKEEKELISAIYLPELEKLVERIRKNGCTRFTLGSSLSIVGEQVYRAALTYKPDNNDTPNI